MGRKKGKLTVRPIYDSIYNFGLYKSKLAEAILGNKKGFIDDTGKFIENKK